MSSDSHNSTFVNQIWFNTTNLSNRLTKQVSNPSALCSKSHENSQRQLLLLQIQNKQKIIKKEQQNYEEKKQQLIDLRRLLAHVNNENLTEIENMKKDIKELAKQNEGYKIALKTVYKGDLGVSSLFWFNECQ